MIEVKIENNLIYLDSDDPNLGSYFTYKGEEPMYDYRSRRYLNVQVTKYIYDGTEIIATRITRYKFKLGWGVYIINQIRDKLTPDGIDTITKTLYSEGYRTQPFPNLLDYQNQDVLHLLKYKYGLFSCYTSYGKTETIVTLLKYLYEETSMKILLLVPSTKCRDELVKRGKCERFNIDIPSKDKRIDLIVTNGVSASKRFTDPTQLVETRKYLETFDCILSDEVEYTMSPGGCRVLDMCINTKLRYGFSGTADKIGGKMITFANGMNDVVAQNATLVSYYGQALVFRLATDLNVNMIYIKSNCFNWLKFSEDDFSSEGNVYLNVLTRTWTNRTVCKFITRIIPYYPALFIPINNLANIISNWIDNYWRDKYRILLISGAGYTYYVPGEDPVTLNLPEACEKINNNEVDVIPSTSSGYRALDLPGLTNILLIQGKIGGVVLQSIGRVARGKTTNIISIVPDRNDVCIPIYSKGVWNRAKMIRDYYKYCNITKTVKNGFEFVQSN